MKNKFYDDCFYHIFNKSIANFGIFSKPINSLKFIDNLNYYNDLKIKLSLSVYLRKNFLNTNLLTPKDGSVTKIMEISIDSCLDYKKFVENNIDYQRKLKHIEKLMID